MCRFAAAPEHKPQARRPRQPPAHGLVSRGERAFAKPPRRSACPGRLERAREEGRGTRRDR